jgi:hypothetical protein
MMISLVIICLIAAIVICVYTGYEFGKSGLVKDKITFQIIFVGIIVNCIYAYLISDLWLILSIIGYVLLIFMLGYVFWRLGVFGGGLVKLFVGMAALIPYPVTINYVTSNFSVGREYSIFVNIFLFILPFLLYVFYMVGISANYVNKEPNSPEPVTVPFNENFSDPETLNYNDASNNNIPTYERLDGNFFEKEPLTPTNYQAKINNNSKKPLVFISHSSEDKIVANAVLAKLEQEKIRCWISYRDILPSLGYGKSIIDAINKSALMVLIFSKNSHDSDQVLREVERAVSKGVPILPLRIEDILPEGDMEYFLSAVHWLDAFEPPLNKHIQILTEKVKLLLNFEKDDTALEFEGYNEFNESEFDCPEPSSNDVFEKIAIQIHNKYRRDMANYKSPDEPLMQPWETLGAKFKISYQEEAKMIPKKLKAVNYGFKTRKPSKLPEFDIIEFNFNELEKIAKIEHNRWCEEKISNGWIYGPKRDNELKTSPYLVPWEELDEDVKNYDRDSVRNIPKILYKAGLEIYSIK